MHKQKTKYNKLKTTTATIAILIIATACSTTKRRDNNIIQSLELQNSTISAALDTNPNEKVKQTDSEGIKFKALTAVLNSNKVIISKLKPEQKKECNCGKNKKLNDR